ncbi:hypothetical protein OROMI_001139 [Orobanche minor]
MALAVSSLTSLTLVSHEQFKLRNPLQRHSRKCWTNSGFCCSLARRRGVHVVGPSSSAGNGVISSVSQTEHQWSSYAWPDNKKRPRICILGGGFGGLFTALRLESLDWPDGKRPRVVLVDQSEHFVFKPLLYELLSGEVDEWEIAPCFSEVLSRTAVQFLKDKVQSLHPSDHYAMDGTAVTLSAGVVHLESGLLIEYDWYDIM